MKPIAAALIMVSFLLVLGCGDSGTTATGADSGAATSMSNTPQDKAARLAAQSQLRNAQMSQEAYYTENEKYASSTSELKGYDSSLNAKVEVMRGDMNGYEMQVTANDSAHTVLILRKDEAMLERVDSSGNPW